MMKTLISQLNAVLNPDDSLLIGVADLSQIVQSDLKYGISIAMPIQKHIVKGILNSPTEAYFDEYHELERKLNALALSGEKFLLEKGFHAYAQTSERVKEDSDWRTEVPYKTIATNAGIGWIGKSCLLITEKYGSAIRLSSILTDAPLICDEPIRESRCGGCQKCVDSCPAHALSGVTWSVDVDRDSILNKEACVEKQIELTRQNTSYTTEFLCGKCFAVCPFTQRYINSYK